MPAAVTDINQPNKPTHTQQLPLSHLKLLRAFSVALVVASLALRCFRAISMAVLEVSATTFDFSITSDAICCTSFALSTAVAP